MKIFFKTILVIILFIGKATSSYSQTTYTFTGNGNWTDTSNWANNLRPPIILDSGFQISINPADNGECILDTVQFITSGATLRIEQGKKFKIIGDLNSIGKAKVIKGKVVLPEGSLVNIADYTVHSILHNSKVRMEVLH